MITLSTTETADIGTVLDAAGAEIDDQRAELTRLRVEIARLRHTTGDLLDALAVPDGRNVRKAWEGACLQFGRFGFVLQRAAFEMYLDELATGPAS